MSASATDPEVTSNANHPAPGQYGTLADPATADLQRAGALPTAAQTSAARKDKVLTGETALEVAYKALSQITDPLSIGAHVGVRREAERLVTHLFDCNLAGYRGWRWAVTLTRPPRARTVTVCELELLPGEDAILAPKWIPWSQRLRPDDLKRSDRLPRREVDERLEPGWIGTSDDNDDTSGSDAQDFGRARVLSAQGIRQAAQRWYDGDHGPEAPGARKAYATCSDCGFLLPLGGVLRNVFGICANEWSVDDGQVVSLDHGCGAHSETDLPNQGSHWSRTPAYLNESELEPLATDGASLREAEAPVTPVPAEEPTAAQQRHAAALAAVTQLRAAPQAQTAAPSGEHELDASARPAPVDFDLAELESRLPMGEK